MPPLLQDWIATTQTIDCSLTSATTPRVEAGHHTYLDSQEKKVQVVVGKRENVLVGHGHEDRGCAVADDREDGIVLPITRGRGVSWSRMLWRAEGPALLLAEFHVVALEESFLLFFGHCCQLEYRPRGGRCWSMVRFRSWGRGVESLRVGTRQIP